MFYIGFSLFPSRAFYLVNHAASCFTYELLGLFFNFSWYFWSISDASSLYIGIRSGQSVYHLCSSHHPDTSIDEQEIQTQGHKRNSALEDARKYATIVPPQVPTLDFSFFSGWKESPRTKNATAKTAAVSSTVSPGEISNCMIGPREESHRSHTSERYQWPG